MQLSIVSPTAPIWGWVGITALDHAPASRSNYDMYGTITLWVLALNQQTGSVYNYV